MIIDDKENFNWDIDNQKWSTLDFVMNKFNYYENNDHNEIIKILPFISKCLWKEDRLINKLIELNLIAEVFKLFPIMSSWDNQSVLEEKLLKGIKDNDTLEQVWNNYLNVSYVYMKQDIAYHDLLKNNQDNLYVNGLLRHISVNQKVSEVFLNALFSCDFHEIHKVYQKVIYFVEKEIFTGKIYHNFTKEDDESVNTNNRIDEESVNYTNNSLNIKKLLLGDIEFNNKTYHFFKGSIYSYLPKDLQQDSDYIYLYLEHIKQCNKRARESAVIKNTNIEENKQYNNIELNILPVEFFNSIKSVANYYLSIVVLPYAKITKENLPDINIFNKSEVLRQHKEKENFWHDLFLEIILLDYEKAISLWDYFIPEEKKNNPEFIVSLLNIYDYLECQSKNIDEKATGLNQFKQIMSQYNFKDLMKYFETVAENLYDSLPRALQENPIVLKNYLLRHNNSNKNNNNVMNILKTLSFEMLDIKSERNVIRKIISQANIFDYIYGKNEDIKILENRSVTNSIEDICNIKTDFYKLEELKIKNRLVMNEWKKDLDLMTHCNSNNLKNMQVGDEVWAEWLKNDSDYKLKKILQINKNMFDLLPEKLCTQEIVLFCMNQSIRLPHKMKNLFWEDMQYCIKACEINCAYIESIPDNHWKNINFIKEIFTLIDDIDKTIVQDMIKKTPIFVQQFLKDHEIENNYNSFLNKYILKHNIENKIQQLNNSLDNIHNTTKSVKKLKI